MGKAILEIHSVQAVVVHAFGRQRQENLKFKACLLIKTLWRMKKQCGALALR